MATTSPTRIDDDLYDSAKIVGPLMSRSAAQQIAHWARVGREVEAASGVSPRAIVDVLTGRSSYDDLNTYEQAVVRAEWTERMDARRTDLNLARDFETEGQSYVELDDAGQVVARPATGRRVHPPSKG